MKLAVTAAAALLTVIGAAVFVLAFIKGKSEYEEWIEPLDEKEFRVKSFLPVGLFLSERISLLRIMPKMLQEYLRKYNARVFSQTAELYGKQDADNYFEIHCACRWVYSLLAFVFLGLFSLISCSNDEIPSAVVFLALSPISLCVMPFLADQELKDKIEKRRDQIQLELPEFINKLILLVNAGSTIPKAWSKIVADSKSDSALFRELRICEAEIGAGKSEAVAYEEFARRCKVKEAIKFTSLIVLNLRKGGSEVVPAMRVQADECWEARRATARRLGEKASSKLLIPMAIMLFGIIIIVALPAVLSLMGV